MYDLKKSELALQNVRVFCVRLTATSTEEEDKGILLPPIKYLNCFRCFLFVFLGLYG